MKFVANFIRFAGVQKFWKSVKIWQSYREFKVGNFFETQCSFGDSAIFFRFLRFGLKLPIHAHFLGGLERISPKWRQLSS